MQPNDLQPHLFTGRWIGETQGQTMPAHLWEIVYQGTGLRVATRWEGDSNVASFFAKLLPGESAFVISGSKTFKAVLVDKQHFVIAGWCTNDARGGAGPDFDVIFSRPGIAELTASRAYSRYLQQMTPGEN